MIYQQLTEEEQAINTAIDRHQEAKKDQRQAGWAFVWFYVAGVILSIVGAKDSKTEHLGTALIVCAIILMLVHFGLTFRTAHYKRKVRELADPYKRKKAVPFYNELVQMFAEQPGIHLHLNDDGSILVTDKREQNGQAPGN